MLIVAVLTVRSARAEEFRRYEQAAARIMARHGGAIERAIMLDPRAGDDPESFRELHVMRFPTTAPSRRTGSIRSWRHSPRSAKPR